MGIGKKFTFFVSFASMTYYQETSMRKILKLSLFSLLALPLLSMAQTSDRNTLRHGPNYPPSYYACAKFDIISSNGVLNKINFKGDTWVEGKDQKEYSLKITNQCSTRVLAVVSVDGLNVLNGKKAGFEDSGYVVDREVIIPGWRKSADNTAAFYFTYPGDSYAERVGKGQNVGVIGVAFFAEKTRPVEIDSYRSAAPAAQSSMGSTMDEAKKSESRDKAEKSLGTGYGRNIDAPVTQTTFERATPKPFLVSQIRYESRENLISMGAIRENNYSPRAFPNEGFVPPPPAR
jgi:hypothetical protein